MDLRHALMGFSMPCEDCPTRECGWNPGAVEPTSTNGQCLAGLDNVWIRVELAVTLRMNKDVLDDIASR